MIRIAPLIADTDQYIGIVYTTKVLIFQVNSTEHDFDSISTIKTDFILDAALSNSAASRTIQCAVVTAAGLRVYVCCGNTVSTLLECDLTYAWPNTKSISVAWMHGADQSESQSLFVSSGPALYAISTAPAVTCECCSVSFAGGVKLETVRAEAIDIQQIFEFAGPSRSIALINRSKATCL